MSTTANPELASSSGHLPETSRAAVFSEVGKPLTIEEFELPKRIEPGAVLCRVRMSTVCGSDLHTIFGRRQEPAPLILGHEILGEVVALGDGIDETTDGKPLRVGDRVTWSIMASCGQCFYCRKSLPQKCESLKKYGHTCCREAPHLTGGYAEYIYLYPGTAIYHVPENLSDEIATPANCALSTVINALETARFASGETVLVQGAGMLGLNLIALCKEAGAAKVIVTDVKPGRLEVAASFGADTCLNVKDYQPDELIETIRDISGGYGIDVAVEVCGNQSAVDQALRSLRIGGRYVIAGLVTPGSMLDVDANQVTRNTLTISGIHNYHPKHLQRALEFLEEHSHEYPYDKLVGARFSLDQINDAIELAASEKHVRVAVCASSD